MSAHSSHPEQLWRVDTSERSELAKVAGGGLDGWWAYRPWSGRSTYHYVGSMVSLDDVIDMITEMPEVTEGSRYRNRTWFVNTKGFAWERPFTKADIARFGEATVPTGTIIALATEDLSEKASVLAAGNPGFFTISHFDNHPAILVQLDAADRGDLHRAIVDAWLACAPEPLARTYLADHT